MENTISNKRKFFGLYTGQDVFEKMTIESYRTSDGGILNLRSVSSITDDELLELREFIKMDLIPNVAIQLLRSQLKYRLGDDYKDWLRSKGFLMPFMDLSVEQIIEYGWVKIIKDIPKEG